MELVPKIIAGLLILGCAIGTVNADNFVSQGGLTWMPVSFVKKWSEAKAYCANTVIDGKSGWRLPTKNELSALYNSGAVKDTGCKLGDTWTSTPDDSGNHYYVVSLHNGNAYSTHELNNYFVTCNQGPNNNQHDTGVTSKNSVCEPSAEQINTFKSFVAQEYNVCVEIGAEPVVQEGQYSVICNYPHGTKDQSFVRKDADCGYTAMAISNRTGTRQLFHMSPGSPTWR
jgi:hypothetical protein